MHLVFVTSIIPDGTPASGYEIANAAILDALRRAGVRVTVIGFTWPGREPADPQNTIVLGSVDVRTDTANAAQKLKWTGTGLVHGLTFSSAKLRVLGPDTVRAALTAVGPFDGYVLNSVQLAGAYRDVFCDRPALYVAHNVEHRSAEESATAARSAIERFMFQREARLLRKLEERLCREARFVFALSEADRQLLGIADEERSAVLPLVTRPVPPEMPATRKTQQDAVLIGTWTWAPNRVGLEWFLDRVVPCLDPEFTVAIAGQTPREIVEGDHRVRFVGRVPDAASFVRSGKVLPLISRAGTGVQLKTIEAFEQGLPSVATSHALRGVATVPPNCTVTDDPLEFAAALQAAAGGAARDIDGRVFYQAQREALDAAMRRGLRAFGFVDEKVAA